MLLRSGRSWLVALGIGAFGCASHRAAPPAVGAAPAPAPTAPPADRDHDGIPDKADECPDEPETRNGCKDLDGCPDKKVAMRRGVREILDKIYFRPRSADLQPIVLALLDNLAAAFVGNPAIRGIELQGHAARNEREPAGLSEARAAAVARYLTAHGVAADRLSTRGYGATKPACAERGESCLSRNRRVEFLLQRPSEEEQDAAIDPHDCGIVLL